jgi:hypothetical protein
MPMPHRPGHVVTLLIRPSMADYVAHRADLA